MPLKIQNYGEWEGDRPGYHPPACTCYECNEGRRRQKAAAAIRQAEESIRQPAAPFPTAKEITRRPATPVSSTKKFIQRPTPPPVSPTPIHRDLPQRLEQRRHPPTINSGGETESLESPGPPLLQHSAIRLLYTLSRLPRW